MRLLAALVAGLLLARPALGAPTVFNLSFSGAAEVPITGDPDGIVSGTLTLDPNDVASPVYGSLSWSITYANLDSLTGMHIHGPGGSVGNPASVFIGMGVGTNGGAGTLIRSYTDANWPGTYTKAQLNQILADASDYYVNLHTTVYPGGANRAQLPEPGSLALVIGSTLALLARRRGR